MTGMQCDHDSHCITCGDTAVALRVLKVDARRELALCADEAGERTTVEIGDSLLVHAGTAIGRAAA
jgi:hypothetical protein